MYRSCASSLICSAGAGLLPPWQLACTAQLHARRERRERARLRAVWERLLSLGQLHASSKKSFRLVDDTTALLVGIFPSPAGRGSTTWQTLSPTSGRGCENNQFFF